MPRHRSTSDRSIQPPALPAQLAPAVTDDSLADGAHFMQCAMLDSHFDAQAADDVLFEQVVGKRVSLNQASLSLAQLFDVRLEACDLAGSEWEKAHLRRVELDGCRLVGLRLSDARIEDVLFHKCNGDLLRVWSSVCKGACFDQCTLREASFDGTDLSGVVFRRCDLSKADFRGTKLRGADLRGSSIEGVQVGIKELQGAIVDTAQAVQLAGLLGITVRDQE